MIAFHGCSPITNTASQRTRGLGDRLERVAPLADEVVCLYAPDDFDAVGRYYREFEQVSDEEAKAVLRELKMSFRKAENLLRATWNR